MLHRLCGPPSIPLSFNLAAVLPRRCAYRVSCDTEELGSPTSSTHRLQRGLPGYLILFAPHAFAPQRSIGPERRLRHRCSSQYLRISPLHWEFNAPLPISSHPVPSAVPRLSPGLSRLTKMAACAPFTPSKSEQRSPPSYYRGCWHEVSRGFFSRYRHHRRGRKSFTTLRPSSLTRHCWIRLAPIVQYSPLLPPVGVWAVSQSQCG